MYWTLYLHSFTGYLHWILLLELFSYCEVFIFTPCSRDSIATKAQIGKTPLIAENLSAKFILELHALL